MRTKTSTQTTLVKYPWKYTVKGNAEGAPVKKQTAQNSPGDGDIATGHGGNVFASLSATCIKDGSYAIISFKYAVRNEKWSTERNADYLYSDIEQ